MTEICLSTLHSCYTSVVHDVMRAMGLRNFTLPPRLRPLNPEGVLTGPAFTIEGRIDETADAASDPAGLDGAIVQVPPRATSGSPSRTTMIVAQMGELSAETLHRKGVLGCRGRWRAARYQLHPATGLSLLGGVPHPARCGRAAGCQRRPIVPILIDDVLIRPGDWLHGDRDGMVCIPARNSGRGGAEIAPPPWPPKAMCAAPSWTAWTRRMPI
ncbi:MAG: hypothetical protein V9G14_14475 [Cypionkella sp.]